jgi:hypothetical protein
VLDAGHRTGDIVLEGEDRPTIGCTAMGDQVLEHWQQRPQK